MGFSPNISFASLGLFFASLCAALADDELTFNRDIRPLLSDKCFACHGFDAKHRKADLRLDRVEGAYGKAESGTVVIKPGAPAESEAWLRIASSAPDEVMPPPNAHKTLSPSKRELIRRWIEQGAKYERHWAFELPVKATTPKMEGAQNPIDGFIRARLAKENLVPSPEADRATLLRRVVAVRSNRDGL